jgi:hypothetical protein
MLRFLEIRACALSRLDALRGARAVAEPAVPVSASRAAHE